MEYLIFVTFFAILGMTVAFDCNTFRPQPEINMTRMLGHWNVHQVSSGGVEKIKSEPTCLHAKLFEVKHCEDEENYFDYVANFDYDYGVGPHTSINVIFPHEDRLGIWNVESIWLNDFMIHIIHTDYNTALAAMCEKNEGNSEVYYIGMLSKSNEPLDESLVAAYKYLLAISGIEPHFQEVVDECELI